MSDLEVILGRNGPLSDARPVPEQLQRDYHGKLPPLLLELWKTQGVGAWANGLFTLCLPGDLSGLISQVFQADADFSPEDCHIFGYSAFGTVFAWSQRHGLVEIHLSRGEVIANGLTKVPGTGALENALTVLLFRLTKDETLDAYDENGKKLFARAVKKIGRPEPGQAFGFVPALAAGGAAQLQNLRIVPILEHFLMLSQLQRFRLVDYLARPAQVVRDIG